MSDRDNPESAKVVPLRQPLKATKASERKWGKPVMGLGFCIVPSLLLRAQQRLKLNPTELERFSSGLSRKGIPFWADL